MASAENAVRTHRVLPVPPDRVNRVFTDTDAIVRWHPPYGYLGKVLEFTEGKGYRMSFRNFTTGG